MKQNERLLVYAVTGFLALILVIAVVFGSDSGRDTTENSAGATGLEQILGQAAPGGGAGGDPAKTEAGETGSGDSRSGLATPNQVRPEQPLVAKPQLATDLVARALGVSRRDRNVRFVRARRGDSLELLVRRWCGARDPYLAEATFLNEDLVVLKVGQEVAVPWIEDEQLVALIEARQPRTLLTSAAAVGNGFGKPVPAVAGPGPDFQLPGALPSASPAAGPSGGALAVSAGTHTVKAGDALWTIAANKYGRGNATRMVNAIKRLNPGLTDSLRIGQKIKLPAAE